MQLSAFDLDRTLLHKNSSFAFCKYLCAEGFFPYSVLFWAFFYYLRHVCLGMTLQDLHRHIFKRVLCGISYPHLAKKVDEFIESALEGLLYQPALQRLKKAQEEGHFTVVLSNSPDFLVRAIAQKLHLSTWRASEYFIDNNEKLCKISSILQGEDKAIHVRQMMKDLKICKEDVIAYSDSHLDLPFLYEAGTAVVVNPTRTLQKIATALGWEKI